MVLCAFKYLSLRTTLPLLIHHLICVELCSEVIFSPLQVHFFRPVPKEYLHSAELRDIMQFGSSNTAVFFKMRVAGVLHIFQFETKQVLLLTVSKYGATCQWLIDCLIMALWVMVKCLSICRGLCLKICHVLFVLMFLYFPSL